MSLARKIICSGAAAAVAAAAVPAFASEPGEGTVSAASPRVDWTGQSINGGATTIPAVANGGPVACVAPSCDTFVLTVVDGADLEVVADAPDTGGFLMINIVKPDGDSIYNSGAEGETTNKVRVKKAAPGEYEVQIATNSLPPTDYTAHARLLVPAAPVPAAPAPAAEEPAATLSLKTRSLSARRARKAPKLTIASDREITDVVVRIKKARKVLGTAKLARLDGTAKVKVKLRRPLSRGRHVVVLGGRQGERTVGATARLRVKR